MRAVAINIRKNAEAQTKNYVAVGSIKSGAWRARIVETRGTTRASLSIAAPEFGFEMFNAKLKMAAGNAVNAAYASVRNRNG